MFREEVLCEQVEAIPVCHLDGLFRSRQEFASFQDLPRTDKKLCDCLPIESWLPAAFFARRCLGCLRCIAKPFNEFVDVVSGCDRNSQCRADSREHRLVELVRAGIDHCEDIVDREDRLLGKLHHLWGNPLRWSLKSDEHFQVSGLAFILGQLLQEA